MYQKITDLYATTIDYDKNAAATRRFYVAVQNKMHYTVHGHTAAKNYLSQDEMKQLNRVVTAYLDFAENMTLRHIPLTMQDWEKGLTALLKCSITVFYRMQAG